MRVGDPAAALCAAVLCGAVAACAAGPDEAGPTWAVEVERAREGGLCAGPEGGGACAVTVVVSDDGTWRAVGYPPPDPSGGAVQDGAATELASTLERGWSDLTGEPFTDTCPVAYDGQEMVYRIRRLPRGPGAERADASVRELRSCTYDLARPQARRWIEEFEERWMELGLPE